MKNKLDKECLDKLLSSYLENKKEIVLADMVEEILPSYNKKTQRKRNKRSLSSALGATLTARGWIKTSKHYTKEFWVDGKRYARGARNTIYKEEE